MRVVTLVSEIPKDLCLVELFKLNIHLLDHNSELVFADDIGELLHNLTLEDQHSNSLITTGNSLLGNFNKANKRHL